MTIHIKSSALTHPGRKRSSNQDFVTFFEPIDTRDVQASGNLYIVADGVGGAAKGDRASQYAAQKVLHDYYRYPQVEIGERLRSAMHQANNDIYSFAERSSGFRMATTMVAAVIRDNLLTIANVGDSRAYILRDGVVKQITRDHSLVGEMVRDGVMTEDEARRSKIKNRITRSLGGEPNVHVDIYPDIQLQTGDRILLCSDGFSQYAENADVAKLISHGYPEDITENLIDFALRRGGSDNISTILLEIVDPLTDMETIRINRGQIPTAVDWDTMDTIPVIPLQYQRPTMWLPPFENWQVLAVAGSVLLTILIISTLVIINWGTSKDDTSELPLPPDGNKANVGEGVIPTMISPTPPNTSVIPSNTPFSSNSYANSPTSIATELPTATIIPMNTVIPTQAGTSIATDASVEFERRPSGENSTAVKFPCQYKYAVKILGIGVEARWLTEYILGTEFANNADFYTYAPAIKCAKIEGNPCLYNGELSPHYLQVGWILEYPSVHPDQCWNVGGNPIFPNQVP